jgi:endonuclease YncB( thermonuclease family)
VIDGDTVEFEAPFLIDPLPKKLSIRVWGVDTPEKSFRAKCEKEAAMGAEATKFTKDLLANAKTTQISIYEWDKYGGRVLGDVIIDGNSLTKMLLDKGYAREYYGDAKQSWCE